MKSSNILFLNLAILFYCTGCQNSVNNNSTNSKTENQIKKCQVKLDSIKEIKIGSQIWSAKDFSSVVFCNGDTIKEAKTVEEWLAAGQKKEPAWCNVINDKANPTFGKLYNFYAITDQRGLSPEGWRIPSSNDWIQLSEFLGELQAGSILKSSNYSDNLIGKNKYAGLFNAYPTFFRNYEGEFVNFIKYSGWWTCTTGETFEDYKIGAYRVFIREGRDDIDNLISRMDNGFAVRLIKN
jgi:uncharacterized protein (TIGR02145 family)